VLKHEVRRLQDCCLGPHRNNIVRHDVGGFHHKSPCVVDFDDQEPSEKKTAATDDSAG
jgi:hypothetical protein